MVDGVGEETAKLKCAPVGLYIFAIHDPGNRCFVNLDFLCNFLKGERLQSLRASYEEGFLGISDGIGGFEQCLVAPFYAVDKKS